MGWGVDAKFYFIRTKSVKNDAHKVQRSRNCTCLYRACARGRRERITEHHRLLYCVKQDSSIKARFVQQLKIGTCSAHFELARIKVEFRPLIGAYYSFNMWTHATWNMQGKQCSVCTRTPAQVFGFSTLPSTDRQLCRLHTIACFYFSCTIPATRFCRRLKRHFSLARQTCLKLPHNV
jgi:hypothetical protein